MTTSTPTDGNLAINRETLAQHGITPPVVQATSMWCSRITAPARRETGQPITLADGTSELVDSQDDIVRFPGPHASLTAAAYYAQAGTTYAQITGHPIPAWISLVLEYAQQAESGGRVERTAESALKRATALATERGHGVASEGKPAQAKAASRRRATARTATPAAENTTTEAIPVKAEGRKPRQAQPAPVQAQPAPVQAPAAVVPAAAAVVPEGTLAVPGCSLTTCTAPSDLLMTHTVGGQQVTEPVCRPHGDAYATDPAHAVTFESIIPAGLPLHAVVAEAVVPGTMPWAMPAELAAGWTVTRVEHYLNRKNEPRVSWRYANNRSSMFASGQMVVGHYVPGVKSSR